MRLIDADALKAIFDYNPFEIACQDVANIIDEQPTIDLSEKRREKIVLARERGGCMKIDTDELMERLRISDSCENCPRHEEGYCKGHLQWLCRRIAECSSEEEE